MTWWDARAFAVEGDCSEWNPSARENLPSLAAFVEAHVLPHYVSVSDTRFRDHVARVGPVGWDEVRSGLLDALKHHPVAGGGRPGTAASQFSPHSFMLLDVLEDQIAGALELESGRDLNGEDILRCARLRPREGSAFEGTLYQHLFLVWAPASRRALWFDLGGSQ
ncbi:MAG: hypothetical protein VX498_09905 [Myxococcota bacterium]|nr:hypothetical protein [Myxococcota bacterium]